MISNWYFATTSSPWFTKDFRFYLQDNLLHVFEQEICIGHKYQICLQHCLECSRAADKVNDVFLLRSRQPGNPILSQNIKIRDVFVQCSMFNVFVQCSMFSLNVFVQCSMFDVQCFHSMFNVFGLNSSQAGHPILSQNIKIRDVFVQCSMFNVWYLMFLV